MPITQNRLVRRPALVAAALLAAATAVPLLAQEGIPEQPTPETALTPGQIQQLGQAGRSAQGAAESYADFSSVIAGLKEVEAPERLCLKSSVLKAGLP
jgi:hypothetical protein